MAEYDIGHAGDVSNGSAVEREPIVRLEMRFQESKDVRRFLSREADFFYGRARKKIDGLDLQQQSEQRAEQSDLVAISRQLETMKHHVGHPFLRSRRPVGRHYLESCRRILSELEAAELALAGQDDEPRGDIAIIAPAMFGRPHVVPIVVGFLDAFPQITARLLLVDPVVDLIEEGLDLGADRGCSRTLR